MLIVWSFDAKKSHSKFDKASSPNLIKLYFWTCLRAGNPFITLYGYNPTVNDSFWSSLVTSTFVVWVCWFCDGCPCFLVFACGNGFEMAAPYHCWKNVAVILCVSKISHTWHLPSAFVMLQRYYSMYLIFYT